MRLNLEKCTFGVRVGKLLGFYLTERGIETNYDKCEVVVHMNVSTLKKEVQKLNGVLTTLKRFISKSAQHVFPFYSLLRKEEKFEWTPKYKKEFESLKKVLATPSILT